MTTQTVIVSIEVAAEPKLAFDVFTSQIDTWWLRGPKHRFRAPWNGTLVFEPGPTGRLLEQYADGTTFVIGRVTQWTPGERLVLSWRLPSFADAEIDRGGRAFRSDRRRHARVGGTPRLVRAARRSPGATRQARSRLRIHESESVGRQPRLAAPIHRTNLNPPARTGIIERNPP